MADDRQVGSGRMVPAAPIGGDPEVLAPRQALRQVALECGAHPGRDVEVPRRRAQEGLDAAVDDPSLMQAIEDVALVQLDGEGLAVAKPCDRLGTERLR